MKVNRFKRGRTIVTVVKGFAIDQDVEVAVNSANNGLLLGSGGCKRIRETTGYLASRSAMMKEFRKLCSTIGPLGVACLKWLKDQKDKPTNVQLECLRVIRRNVGHPMEVGKAVLTSAGILTRPAHIVHAVAMGYTWKPKPGDSRGNRIKATEKSLSDSLQSAFGVVRGIGAKSLAMPLMCVRPEYGIGPATSFAVSLAIIAESQLDQVVICADNEQSQKFFDDLP